MIALTSVLPPTLTEFIWDRTIFRLRRRGGFSIQSLDPTLVGCPILSRRMGHPEIVDQKIRENHLAERMDRERSASRGQLLIGFSTHNLAQVIAADSLPIDYIAIGPVFATGSKANPDPVVGLEGVRQARQVTKKPLVAIGGITRQNCSQVKAAGADAVAVISDLLESPAKAVADFLRVLG